MNNPILSLCIPTNGVSEWVFPVLESIMSQGCESFDFEVVVTDNGSNVDFKEKMVAYRKMHECVQYYETDALLFLNEIESYRKAKGKLIKFVNHRTKLVPGSLFRLIEYAKANKNTKPVTYFANGKLGNDKQICQYKTFDDFVKNLSYWSSWSTGMTIWKEDFEKLFRDISSFNELFPHTNVLFAEKNRNNYVIDNTIIFDEIPQGKKPKGRYDLFYAFGVEFPAIILELYRSSNISASTLKKVLHDNLTFIANLYFQYLIKKSYCSYNLNGLKDMYGIFYTRNDLYHELLKHIFRKSLCKIQALIKR